MPTREHGYARYKLDGCRCNLCGYAVSQYNRNVAVMQAAGTWKPFVDAEPVRQHVLGLKAEYRVGDRCIARLAGVTRNTMRSLLYGRKDRGTPPSPKLRTKTAAAILSVGVTLDDMPARLRIDRTGTERRIQAAIAGGFPQAFLARRLGQLATNFSYSLNHTEHVEAQYARAVRDLYAEILFADPADYGVTLNASSRAVNHGKAMGWAPAHCWDDDTIDDPQAFPEWTGRCGSESGYNIHFRDKIPVCDACRRARAAERAERRVPA